MVAAILRIFAKPQSRSGLIFVTLLQAATIGITQGPGININLVSHVKKSISLPWDSARKYWSECISANQNASHRTFVPVNQASLTNLRSHGKCSSHFIETHAPSYSYGKLSSHFTEISPSSS